MPNSRYSHSPYSARQALDGADTAQPTTQSRLPPSVTPDNHTQTAKPKKGRKSKQNQGENHFNPQDTTQVPTVTEGAKAKWAQRKKETLATDGLGPEEFAPPTFPQTSGNTGPNPFDPLSGFDFGEIPVSVLGSPGGSVRGPDPDARYGPPKWPDVVYSQSNARGPPSLGGGSKRSNSLSNRPLPSGRSDAGGSVAGVPTAYSGVPLPQFASKAPSAAPSNRGPFPSSRPASSAHSIAPTNLDAFIDGAGPTEAAQRVSFQSPAPSQTGQQSSQRIPEEELWQSDQPDDTTAMVPYRDTSKVKKGKKPRTTEPTRETDTNYARGVSVEELRKVMKMPRESATARRVVERGGTTYGSRTFGGEGWIRMSKGTKNQVVCSERPYGGHRKYAWTQKASR